MLVKSFHILNMRFDQLSKLFDNEYRLANSVGLDRAKRWHSLEGLLSVAWQTWCWFCRDAIHSSCNGTATLEGVVVPAIASPPSYGRIAYVTKQRMQGKRIKPFTELQVHQEPTWGDPQVLLEAVDEFAPANSSSLIAGLKYASFAPEHMRCVRSAVAHFSKPNIDKVKRISVYYTGSNFFHPLDFLYWTRKGTGEDAFLDWLEDLRDMADTMCR